MGGGASPSVFLAERIPAGLEVFFSTWVLAMPASVDRHPIRKEKYREWRWEVGPERGELKSESSRPQSAGWSLVSSSSASSASSASQLRGCRARSSPPLSSRSFLSSDLLLLEKVHGHFMTFLPTNRMKVSAE